jgi:hypothetical protein
MAKLKGNEKAKNNYLYCSSRPITWREREREREVLYL